MIFEYEYVKKDNIDLLFERNALRLRPKTGHFGYLKNQEEDQVFEAHEIVIHTPAEHHIFDKEYPMEVQILHKTIDGDFKFQAVVSFLYERVPGDVKPIFKAFDLINLPNAQDNVGEVEKDIHPLSFLFDYENQIMN